MILNYTEIPNSFNPLLYNDQYFIHFIVFNIFTYYIDHKIREDNILDIILVNDDVISNISSIEYWFYNY